jgi:NitT/TauT family transport system permease protein
VTKDLETTLYETLVGFAISVVAGFLFGVLLSRAPLLHRAVLPILTAANSLPRIALAPLFILWFGLGPFAKIALVVSFVFFVMLATTIAGFTQPNSDFELLAGSIGASSWQEVTLFLLPGAMPSLIAGLELSLVYSFLGAVSGEIVGGESGLGVQLTSLSNGFEINKFLAVLLLLVIVTTFTVVIMRLITAPLTRWHKAESRRGDQL